MSAQRRCFRDTLGRRGCWNKLTLEEVGGAGVYLLSPMSGGVTGEIHYVDSGYNIISMPRPEEL